MDTTSRPIPFLDALSHLQAMLGKSVHVEFNDYGNFFGGGFEGCLERVETMPPDNTAIRAIVADGGGFFLEPASVESYLVAEPGGGASWLEFQPRAGCTVAVKAVESA